MRWAIKRRLLRAEQVAVRQAPRKKLIPARREFDLGAEGLEADAGRTTDPAPRHDQAARAEE
jgi:hypothetical protein